MTVENIDNTNVQTCKIEENELLFLPKITRLFHLDAKYQHDVR